MVGLLLCVLGTIPLETVVRDHVDAIEVNAYYDNDGQYVFSQILFRRYDGRINKYPTDDWRLVKQPHNVPAQGTFIFFDEQDHTLRRVTYDRAYQTWTQVDPELVDREILPKEYRQGLSRPFKRSP